ncbi:E3 ubiquitin-protein ligase BRE1B [Orchesella cincta]|uniref:E3 ubiquitin protein ligase n=1 Tax=Orchesella cincta TaxID=48709 RepID=A0A1D2MNY5_ORCCI|nr:E3 ubiquitin-protein ligase BRE1B [Orchesella cincta]
MRWGGIFRVWYFNKPWVMVASADDCQKLYSSARNLNEKSDEVDITKLSVGDGLYARAGSLYHERRKLLNPGYGISLIRKSIPNINQHSAMLVKTYLKFAESGENVNTYPIMTKAAIRLVWDSLFGKKIADDAPDVSNYINAMFTSSYYHTNRVFKPWLRPDFIFNMTAGSKLAWMGFISSMISPKGRIYWEKKKTFSRRSVEDVSKSSEESENVKGDDWECYLDYLLEQQEKGLLQEKDVLCEFSVFTIGGYETTSIALTNALYLLATYPEHQKKIVEELDSIFGEGFDPSTFQVTMNQVKEMKHLDLCLKEVLRLYPPLSMSPKRTTEDIQLDDGRVIPAGVQLFVFMYWIHRDPKYFPDPEAFIPERFSKESDFYREKATYSYIPFSVLPRSCIGQSYAMVSLKIFLAYLLKAYEWTAVTPRDQLKMSFQYSSHPKNSILKLKPRIMSEGSKRPHSDGDSGNTSNGGPCPSPPPWKKMLLEPISIGRISSLEEMNCKVLKVQHEQIRQRLQQRQKLEEELNKRIEQLENQLRNQTCLSNGINRHWSQLNEDLGILLRKFHTGMDQVDEVVEGGGFSLVSSVAQLTMDHPEELDTILEQQRVKASIFSVVKMLEAFENLRKRREEVTAMLNSGEVGTNALESAVWEANIELESENQRLHALNTHLHQQYQVASLKTKELEQKLIVEEGTKVELHNRIEDLNTEMFKLVCHNEKLVAEVQNLNENYKRLQQQSVSDESKISSQGSSQSRKDRVLSLSQEEEVELLRRENESFQELADKRLSELEDLHRERQEERKELDKLRQEIRYLPERVIVESVEYKCLQSKFSVVYNDNLQLRSVLEEMKQRMTAIKNDHMKRIEQLEIEEETLQNLYKSERLQMAETQSQLEREHEMLRIEFKQSIETSDQPAKVTREMRVLITSLQHLNEQLKAEVQKYRRKYREVYEEVSKLKRRRSETATALEQNGGDGEVPSTSCFGSTSSSSTVVAAPKTSESDVVKELQSKVKRCENEKREMKTLLDMYKGASKEHREKVELMSAERKLREELEELKRLVGTPEKSTKMEERSKEALYHGDSGKRIKCLEEQVHALQRQVTLQKQEEAALLNDMETTGQAFEEMQEQNARLIQELRNKDDANFKLMEEKIKASHIQAARIKEKQLLDELTQSLQKKNEALGEVIKQMEEKEKVLLQTLASREKESLLKSQAVDVFKAKAVEELQKSTDLKLLYEKAESHLNEMRQTVSEKTSLLEMETHKARRLEEEVALMRGKVERLNKLEKTCNADEVYKEEIRIYKDALTCPSCKVNRKDAVLTKCFHVFCHNCIKTRYDTRQRKCPKCNAPFGHNDYHHLYLT